MHRIDNSRFLLYIEPLKETKSFFPANDEFTQIMELAFSEAVSGVASYSKMNIPEWFEKGSGSHCSDCGERSDNQDYLLKNGMITNSLCVFYLQYYRNSIPESEVSKIKELVEFYKSQNVKI